MMKVGLISDTHGLLRPEAVAALAGVDVEADTSAIAVIVAGHSHKPAVVRREGVLFVNPGSAGPRRFNLPVSIGYLIIGSGGAQARILERP